MPYAPEGVTGVIYIQSHFKFYLDEDFTLRSTYISAHILLIFIEDENVLNKMYRRKWHIRFISSTLVP
jgi:hypothetical protein